MSMSDPRMQFYAARLKHIAHYSSQVELAEDTNNDPQARAEHKRRVDAIDAVYEEMAGVGLIRRPGDDSMSRVWDAMRSVQGANHG